MMSQTADADIGDLADLRKQVEEGKKREAAQAEARMKAEQEAAAAKQQVERAIQERVGETEAAVAQALALAESEAENYKTALERAYAEADFKAAAELSLKAGSVSVRRDQLVAKQQEIANWKENVRKQAEAQRNNPKPQGDPLAAFSEPTRAWLKEHPQVLTDARIGSRAKAYSIEAEDRGIKPDTPEYFDYVNERLGWKKPAPQDDEGDDALSGASDVTIADNDQDVAAQTRQEPQQRLQRPQQSATGSAATPSRGNGGGQPRQRQQVSLTPEERSFAVTQTSLGKTPEERIAQYALNKTALKAEGRL